MVMIWPSNCLWNSYVCTHRLVLMSIFIKGAFFAKVCDDYRPINGLKELRINEWWMLSHQWDIYITPSKAQETLQKRLKEIKSKRKCMYVGGSRILTSGSDTVLTLLNSAFVIFMNNSESINTLFWNKEGLIVSAQWVAGIIFSVVISELQLKW